MENAHYTASKPSGTLLERIQLLEQRLPEDVQFRVMAKRKEIAQYRVELLNSAAARKPTESSSHTYSVDLKLYLAALTSLEQEAAFYEDSCWAEDPRLFECHLRLLELDHLKQQYHNEVRALQDRGLADKPVPNPAQRNDALLDVPPEITQQSFDKVASWDISLALAEQVPGPAPVEEVKSTYDFDDAFSAVPVSEYLAAARQAEILKHNQSKVKLVHQGREVEVSPEVYKLYESLDINVLCELAKLMLVPSSKGDASVDVATQKPYVMGSDPQKDKVLNYLTNLPDPVQALFTGAASHSSNTKDTQATQASNPSNTTTSSSNPTPRAPAPAAPMKLVLRESKGSWRNKKYVWQLGEDTSGISDDATREGSWSTMVDKDGVPKVVVATDSGARLSKVKKLLRVVSSK